MKDFDFAIFVVYQTEDFPDLPYLAQLLDGIPKDRRVVIDCHGRYNDTIRVEHDFNHLEKLDGHQGWEWIEGFQAISDRILQPTLKPLRDDVQPFLFHGFDPAAISTPHSSAAELAKAWLGDDGASKPLDLVYVGNNWQRWTQVRDFLESIEPIREKLGSICLTGWDWDVRPDWAAELGLLGADLDPALLQRLDVETREAVPFDEVVKLIGQARFSPIFHRPLFNHLGIVTNRTFETFCADTIPLLMLPDRFIEPIYGPGGSLLAPGDDLAGCIDEMMSRPEIYWNAVLEVRNHLAEHHSYEKRFRELQTILKD